MENWCLVVVGKWRCPSSDGCFYVVVMCLVWFVKFVVYLVIAAFRLFYGAFKDQLGLGYSSVLLLTFV